MSHQSGAPVRYPRQRRRLVRAGGYMLMAAAGMFAAQWPAPAVERATAPIAQLLMVWAVFLTGGGLLSAFGAITDRWIGEYLGLPLLTAVAAVYGVSALSSGRTTSLAGGAVLLAMAAFLAVRWLEVAAVRKAVQSIAPRHRTAKRWARRPKGG
jgi:hypothetical protein